MTTASQTTTPTRRTATAPPKVDTSTLSPAAFAAAIDAAAVAAAAADARRPWPPTRDTAAPVANTARTAADTAIKVKPLAACLTACGVAPGVLTGATGKAPKTGGALAISRHVAAALLRSTVIASEFVVGGYGEEAPDGYRAGPPVHGRSRWTDGAPVAVIPATAVRAWAGLGQNYLPWVHRTDGKGRDAIPAESFAVTAPGTPGTGQKPATPATVEPLSAFRLCDVLAAMGAARSRQDIRGTAAASLDIIGALVRDGAATAATSYNQAIVNAAVQAAVQTGGDVALATAGAGVDVKEARTQATDTGDGAGLVKGDKAAGRVVSAYDRATTNAMRAGGVAVKAKKPAATRRRPAGKKPAAKKPAVKTA
jgi:hypothetical protein